MAPASQDPTEPATVIEDVEVTARTLSQQASNFLDTISLPEATLKVARWQERVCVGAVNFRAPAGQFLADRVSEVAMELGLRPGDPGCRPNIMVFASSDASELATAMVDHRRRLFDPGGSGMVRTRQALSRFTSTDAPIRWWHVAYPVDSRSGLRANRLPGEDAPYIAGVASRLRTTIRNDLGFAMIIVDVPKLEGLDMLQISDYVAMVAFSQVDSDADFTGYDTILSLMDDKTVRGLTEWDWSYLKALYSAELMQVNKRQQEQEIARLMAQRRHQETQPNDPAPRD